MKFVPTRWRNKKGRIALLEEEVRELKNHLQSRSSLEEEIGLRHQSNLDAEIFTMKHMLSQLANASQIETPALSTIKLVGDKEECGKYVGCDEFGHRAVVTGDHVCVVTVPEGLNVGQVLNLNFPMAKGTQKSKGFVIGPFIQCATREVYLVQLVEDINYPQFSSHSAPTGPTNVITEHQLVFCDSQNAIYASNGYITTEELFGIDLSRWCFPCWAHLGHGAACKSEERTGGAVFIGDELYGVATPVNETTYWIWNVTDVPKFAYLLRHDNADKLEAAGYEGPVPLRYFIPSEPIYNYSY